MSPVVMRRHAPAAQALGVATLANYRFVITMDGYASVRPARAQSVYGVLWRLTSRDRVRLDAWENIAGGLYHAMTLPVHLGSCRRAALVYVARPSGEGRAKSGYMDLVIAAARAWRLPADYVAALQRWRPAHARTSRRKLGDFGWS